jgi:predicted RNA polymerase sigma factor
VNSGMQARDVADAVARRSYGVLDAIYATFAEGWSDPGGTDVARRDLTTEALFLARLVVAMLPQEPEALGMLALMLHADARRRARRNANGDYVPLAEQDVMPMRWLLALSAIQTFAAFCKEGRPR